MKPIDILIVGAGISGLMAASTIQSLSCASVQMIEKEQDPGGRFATQLIGGGTFDHGAQFITARSDHFRAIVKTWLAEGWITPWYGENNPRYAAVGGMGQLAERLTPQHRLEGRTWVDSITPIEGGYLVKATDTLTKTPKKWLSKAVLLTCPIPQMFPLLEDSQSSIDSGARAILERVQYMPSLALLIGLGEDIELPEGFLREPFPGIISWIADNRYKGISDIPAWTIHLDPDWSEAHYLDTDEEVWFQVLPYLKKVLGRGTEHLVVHQIKRWRYAKASHLIQAPYMDVGHKFPLVLTGDAFDVSPNSNAAGSRVENAVLSGIEAGRYLAERFQADM